MFRNFLPLSLLLTSAWPLLSPVNIYVSASMYVQNIPGSQFSVISLICLTLFKVILSMLSKLLQKGLFWLDWAPASHQSENNLAAPMLVNEFQGTPLSTASHFSPPAFLEWPLAKFSESQHSPGCNPNR